jgi:nicotinamide-nucleotide amidase
MRLSYLAIGDELLDGRVREGNLVALGDHLRSHGLSLDSASVVGDGVDTIADALENASTDADLLIVSGGLGPTRDDVTRYAAAEWASSPIELDEQHLSNLKEEFAARGYTFSENNRRQCEFPQDAEILGSEVGTASGFRLVHNECEAYFLPGVPREFRWHLRRFLTPKFEDIGAGAATPSGSLTFLGPGESGLEKRLAEVLEAARRQGATVSFLADAPLVTVEVRAPDRSVVEKTIAGIEDRSGPWVVASERRGVAESLGRRLASAGATVSTAESCTGGWIGKLLTDVPGASEWFEYGWVSYANAAKMGMLGVDSSLLHEHGAVSREVVCAMAEGARDRADADWSLAVSGIAGPSGGTPEKPVGRVHFGLAGRDELWHHRASFDDRGRTYVRRASALTAMAGLIWRLDGHLDTHDWTRIR